MKTTFASITVFLFWGLPFLLHAQTPAFLQYTVEDGLPSNLVYCVEQDSRGFIWFGTDKGLARFDGIRFKVYGVKDGLPDPEVLNIYEDSQGRLWLSCFQKKPCYLKDGEFFTEDTDSLLNKIELKSGTYSFFEASDGNLWIAGDEYKCCRINYKDNECEILGIDFYARSKENRKMGSIRKIAEIDNRIIAICNDGVFEVFNSSKKANVNQFIFERLYDEKLKDDFTIRNELGVFDGKLIYQIPWTGGNVYFFEYRREGLKLIESKTEMEKGHPIYLKNELYWLTKIGSIYKYKIDKGKIVQEEFYSINADISNIHKDDNYWVTTLDNGVFLFFSNNAFVYTKDSVPFKSNKFSVIEPASNSTLVVGDNLGNLYASKECRWLPVSYTSTESKNIIRQIYAAGNDEWHAIGDHLLFSSLSGNTYPFFSNNVNKWTPGALKSISKIGNETWLGTSSYLFHWQDNNENINAVLEERVTDIERDHEMNVWVGGLEGIFCNLNNFSSINVKKYPELKERIIDIESGKKGELWLSNSSGNLYKAEIQKGEILQLHNASDSAGINSATISKIHFSVLDSSVWLATNKGIYHLINDEVNEIYNESDGLPSNDVSDVVMFNDTLWATTNSGLFCMPLGARNKRIDFPVYFTDLKYEAGRKAKNIDLTSRKVKQKDIIIPYAVQNLELEMAAINFRFRDKIRFEYVASETFMPIRIMTWGNLFSALFNEVDTMIVDGGKLKYRISHIGGKKDIRIYAITPNGNSSSNYDTLNLVFLPHWSNTIWFSLLLGALIFFILRRIYLTTTAYRRLESQANKLQLQAIKAQINPHFVGNSINAIQQFFYPPEPKKASEYISIFTNLLRRTMALSERNFIPIDEELSFIQEYLQMVHLRFGKRFVFEISGHEKIHKDTMFPSMILQPILENATIHGLAEKGISKLKIDFFEKDNRLYCSIVDNGPGIRVSQKRKKEQGTQRKSKGIILLKKKIDMLNRMRPIKLQIEFTDLSDISDNESGTKVILSFIPFKA